MPFYQLKISLKTIDETVTRTIVVEDSITFSQLHLVIQGVMGWRNIHCFHFYNIKQFNKKYINPFSEYFCKFTELDSCKTKLSDANLELKQRFKYCYDFGKCWEHVIFFERIFYKVDFEVPKFICGKNECPLEGGFGWCFRI